MPTPDDGYELGNGMVMTLARVTSISPRPDRFLHFRVDAPLIARMLPHGLAPVFKIFTARTDGAPITLPTFDKNRIAIPSWESDPTRPIARAYTALHFTPGDTHITFDALDLGHADSWTRRARSGDTVGIIGFKHELTLQENIKRLLLIGDHSAKPAIDEILRSTPEHLGSTVIDLNSAVSDEHDLETAIRSSLTDDGKNTIVWIGGEVQHVATVRSTAIASGIDPAHIISLPYWHQGLSREHYDRVLYRRYQAAAERGESLTDPTIIAQVELTPVEPAEQHPR